MKPIHITILVAFLFGVSFSCEAVDMQDGDKVAIMFGQQRMEIWEWDASGYARLVTGELANAGIRKSPLLLPGSRKTDQMLENLQEEVLAPRPVFAVIYPGTADYNVFAEKTPKENFRANLKAIVEQLQAEDIKPVLVTSYAMNSNRNFSPNQNVALFNEEIRTLAQELKVKLIDFTNVVDQEKSGVELDGSLAAKALVNQMFAGEILRVLGFSDEEVAACRQAWLDLPGAVRLTPTVSVNTYEKMKSAARASGRTVKDHMSEVLHNSLGSL